MDHYNVHGMKIIGDELYIGVFSGGLNIYNLKTKKISHYYISDDRYNVDNSIYSICYAAGNVSGSALREVCIGLTVRPENLLL